MGGPLATGSRTGTPVLVGITSFGIKCGLPGVPGVYTEVSRYRDWILDDDNDGVTKTDCGNRRALSCAQCPQDGKVGVWRGRLWCNGECEWMESGSGSCVEKTQRHISVSELPGTSWRPIIFLNSKSKDDEIIPPIALD